MGYKVMLTYDWRGEADGAGLLRFDGTARHAAAGDFTAVFPMNHAGALRVLADAIDPDVDVRRWGIELEPDPPVLGGYEPALAGWVDDATAVEGAPSGFDDDAIVITGFTDVTILRDQPSYPVPASDTSTTTAATMAAAYDALLGNGEAEFLQVVRANVGPSAPARRRWPFLAIPATPGTPRGGNVDVGLRFPTLLDLAGLVAAQAGLTIDVVRTGASSGPALQLTTAPVQTNHNIVLSRDAGTVEGSVARRTADKAMSVLALGKGDLEDRVMTRRDRPPPAGGTAWQSEVTVDAASDDDPAKLGAAAQRRLDELAGGLSAQLDIAETVDWTLGGDFRVGQRVAVMIAAGGLGLMQQITGAHLQTTDDEWTTTPLLGPPLDKQLTVLTEVINAVRRRGRG